MTTFMNCSLQSELDADSNIEQSYDALDYDVCMCDHNSCKWAAAT